MVLFALAVPFFFLQLLLLRLTKKWPLRLLPVYPIILLLLAAGYYWLFTDGWDQLAALIFGLLAIGPAVGCGLAAAVYNLSGRLRFHRWLIVGLVLLGWFGAWLGQEISLGYWDRAFIKTLSFLGCVVLYRLLAVPFHERSGLSELFRIPDRSSLKTAGILALAVFLFLTVGYMLLSPWIDLSAIPEKLRGSDVTAENFPLVAAYITLCNSFLEEFFFRGFAFLTLRRHTGEKFAHLFSGVTFAAYHVSIMSGWFHPIWFVLFLAGLAVGGMIFNFLDRRGSLWCGWLVHASADLAIMLIGMRMFGIL
jgi:membrane protease YdiL (CAAX protease family)